MWGLKKGLYGLVQAGTTWSEGINAYIESDGFTATPKDPAICVKNSWTDRDFAPAGFLVYDCVAIGQRKENNALAKSVDAEYGIAGLGEVRRVGGMLLERSLPPAAESVSHVPFTILWYYCSHKYPERPPWVLHTFSLLLTLSSDYHQDGAIQSFRLHSKFQVSQYYMLLTFESQFPIILASLDHIP